MPLEFVGFLNLKISFLLFLQGVLHTLKYPRPLRFGVTTEQCGEGSLGPSRRHLLRMWNHSLPAVPTLRGHREEHAASATERWRFPGKTHL